MNPEHVNLVRAAASGDSRAFSELASQYRRVAASVAFGILQDKNLASDAVQDAFLKAFERIDQLNEPEAFVSWFLSTVRMTSIDMLRKQKRWGVREIAVGSVSDSGDDESEPTGRVLSGTAPQNPFETLEGSERSGHIRDALASLSPEYREVILLKHSEGRSYREIAKLLKTSVRSVESRLFRARQQFSKALEQKGIRPGGGARQGGKED